jgi:hypothetical protein
VAPFETKYGPEVLDALREARAAHMPPSKVLAKLRAGTLDGTGPVDMPDRTFWLKWRQAKRELEAMHSSEDRHRRASLIAQLVGVEAVREGRSVEEVAEEHGIPVDVLRECVAEDEEREAKQEAERRKIERRRREAVEHNGAKRRREHLHSQLAAAKAKVAELEASMNGSPDA